jgi:hypothetical protein
MSVLKRRIARQATPVPAGLSDKPVGPAGTYAVPTNTINVQPGGVAVGGPMPVIYAADNGAEIPVAMGGAPAQLYAAGRP